MNPMMNQYGKTTPQPQAYGGHQQQQQQQHQIVGGQSMGAIQNPGVTPVGQQQQLVMNENMCLYSTEVSKNPSCIFFGNIPYDATEQDLRETLNLAGPFMEFRLKTDPKTNQPKGFGFCEYRDPDIAACALRNLNKSEINGRNLKVDFASDNKNGTNLKEEDVKFRDRGEMVTLKGEYLNDHESSVEEILNSLSTDQEQLLLFGIKDIYDQMARENPRLCEQMIENLAQDESLLDNLTGMLERVQALHGGPQFMSQGGIYHYSSGNQGAPGGMGGMNPHGYQNYYQ
eukprot:403333180